MRLVIVYKESCHLITFKMPLCNFLIHNTLIKYSVGAKGRVLKKCYVCV